MKEKKFKRGSIYFADLDPIKGSEQGGYRPVLIIQNNIGNEYSPTVIVAPITSRPKTKLPTHVPVKDIKGLEKDSAVLLEQVRTLDKSRLDDYLGSLDRYKMAKVDESIRISMGVRRQDKPIRLTLCPVCAKPFYESGEHYIKRVDVHQRVKEECMFCSARMGVDYLIRKKY